MIKKEKRDCINKKIQLFLTSDISKRKKVNKFIKHNKKLVVYKVN